MYQVEYGVKDKEKAALTHPAIAELESNREGYKDDFELNYIARKQFRVRLVLISICACSLGNEETSKSHRCER